MKPKKYENDWRGLILCEDRVMDLVSVANEMNRMDEEIKQLKQKIETITEENELFGNYKFTELISVLRKEKEENLRLRSQIEELKKEISDRNKGVQHILRTVEEFRIRFSH